MFLILIFPWRIDYIWIRVSGYYPGERYEMKYPVTSDRGIIANFIDFAASSGESTLRD
jgi:hypothetical protein